MDVLVSEIVTDKKSATPITVRTIYNVNDQPQFPETLWIFYSAMNNSQTLPNFPFFLFTIDCDSKVGLFTVTGYAICICILHSI